MIPVSKLSAGFDVFKPKQKQAVRAACSLPDHNLRNRKLIKKKSHTLGASYDFRKRVNTTSWKQFLLAIVWKAPCKKRRTNSCSKTFTWILDKQLWSDACWKFFFFSSNCSHADSRTLMSDRIHVSSACYWSVWKRGMPDILERGVTFHNHQHSNVKLPKIDTGIFFFWTGLFLLKPAKIYIIKKNMKKMEGNIQLKLRNHLQRCKMCVF